MPRPPRNPVRRGFWILLRDGAPAHPPADTRSRPRPRRFAPLDRDVDPHVRGWRELYRRPLPGDSMAVQDGTGSFAVLTAGNSKTYANASDTPAVQEGANLGDTILYAAGDFTVATPVFQETST